VNQPGGLVILGRARECLQLDSLLAATADHGGALLLKGEAGIGKTALLDYASDVAADSGTRVVRVRGVESASVLPFATLADLLAPFDRERTGLPVAQRSALAVCLAQADGAAAPNPLAVCAGTLNVLADAAEAAPLVVLVDDLQWVDPPSRQVLLFVARRLSGERAAMVITVRPDHTELSEASGLPELDLAGLPEDACLQLLSSRGVELSAAVAAELVHASRGNPLALLETARSLDPAQLRGERPLPELLPAGRQVRRAWESQLSGLPEPTLRALVLVAASRSATLDPLRSALVAAGLSLTDLDAAERAGLVTSTGQALNLRHPLLRSVLLERVSPSARLAAYQVLAQVSAGDERVWYQAAATGEPDEGIAAALVEVAGEARRRGGYGAAAGAWRRAAQLTPDRRQQAERLLQAALDAHLGGHSDEAVACGAQAWMLADDPALRADIELARGRALSWAGHPARAHGQLVDAARSIGGQDPQRASALFAEATVVSVMACDVATALRDVEQCIAHASQEPFWPITVFVGYALLMAGRVDAGRALLRSGPPPSAAAGDSIDDQQFLAVFASCLGWLDEPVEAGRRFDAVIDAARRHGAPAILGYALGARSDLEYWTGAWAAAYADATESLRWSRDLRQAGAVGFSLACLARVDAARGDGTRAREHLALAQQTWPSSKGGWQPLYRSSILGLAALGHGNHAAAVRRLERARRLAQDSGIGVGSMAAPIAADLVEAHVRAGNRDQAQEVLASLEESAQATGTVWSTAAAARCRILLAPTADAADASFAAAEAAYRRRDIPFEHARTQLCYGEALRRFRRPAGARAPLLAARTTFEALGAVGWAGRAGKELAAAGVRAAGPPRLSPVDQLTPQELQIARAIADGMSNVEAAAALFVSRKTVEAHLTRIYRKLGLRSRTELTRTLASRGLGNTGGPEDTDGPGNG